tara:strand:+ start:42 stop:686 length:645 start_codon:yes stop_codon:yes gene_type:complete
MEEDFNIKVSVRNGRLLRAIRAKYDSVAELSRQLVRGRSQVNALVTMKLKPFNHKGWTDLALDVAAMVGKEPEDLWPDHLRELQLAKSTSEMEVGLDSVKRLIQDGTTEKTLSQISAISTLSEALTPRERKCLAMRFALGHSLEETARVLGVTRERARQIEAKAIRRMKRAATVHGYRKENVWASVFDPEIQMKQTIKISSERITNKGLDLFND